MKKEERTLVFGSEIDMRRMLNLLAGLGCFDNLRGYPNYELVETATGKVIMRTPSVVGETYPAIWDIVTKKLGLTEVKSPDGICYMPVAAE